MRPRCSFRNAARAVRSSSLISVASFCRGGCAGGAFAGLDEEAPPNNQGFARLNCAMRWAAFSSSPSAVELHVVEVEQLQPVEIYHSGPHRLDFQFGTDKTRSRLLFRLCQSALERLGTGAQFGDLIAIRSGEACRCLTSIVPVGRSVGGNARKFGGHVFDVEGVGDGLDCSFAADLARIRQRGQRLRIGLPVIGSGRDTSAAS